MKKKLSVVIAIVLLLVAMTVGIAVAVNNNKGKDEVHKHSYGEWMKTTDATCTLVGAKERKCSGCVEKETATIDKLAHTPAADDNNCTTAVTCTVCKAETTAAKVHKESTAWKSDGTGHWRECENIDCSKVMVEMAAHTPAADDNDCTTETTCTECAFTTTEATAHKEFAGWNSDTTDHWRVCINDGCGKNVVDITAHTLVVDDNDCATAITCTICQFITTEAIAHKESTAWKSDETGHWNECTNDGCVKNAVEKKAHTSGADDDNCLTAVTCTACTIATIPAQTQHTEATAWKSDGTDHWRECGNDGCKHIMTAKDSHVWIGESNECACGAVDDTIFTIENNVVMKCIPGEYKSITMPSGVTSIGEQAFYDCQDIVSVKIPDSVTTIANSAFRSCRGLTSITIPNSVTTIGNNAFTDCRTLTSVTIPDSVISIGNGAFGNNSKITSLSVASGNTNYHSEGNCIIETATKTLIAGCMNSVIPTDGSVTSIDNHAFSGSTGLTSIVIPSSVTTIGDFAFFGCSSLTSVTFSEGGLTKIGASAFQDCSALTSIRIPSGVTLIDGNAFFNCGSLTAMYIPDTVTEVGSGAVDYCYKLTAIELEYNTNMTNWNKNWNPRDINLSWLKP